MERVFKIHICTKIGILNPWDKKRLVFIKSGNIFNGSLIYRGNELGIKVQKGKETRTFVRCWIPSFINQPSITDLDILLFFIKVSR